jgi:hypothetical protein
VQVITKPLHKLRLDEIETEHVVAVLRKIWHQREISRDTRQRLKKILDAAIALNLRPKHNPADWDNRLKPIMPKQSKRGTTRGSHKAIEYHDLPAFMEKLAANPEQSARALEAPFSRYRERSRCRTCAGQNSISKVDFGIWAPLTPRTNGPSARHCPGKPWSICARPTRAA